MSMALRMSSCGIVQIDPPQGHRNDLGPRAWSAPFITRAEENFPVPRRRRDWKVRPAIISGVSFSFCCHVPSYPLAFQSVWWRRSPHTRAHRASGRQADLPEGHGEGIPGEQTAHQEASRGSTRYLIASAAWMAPSTPGTSPARPLPAWSEPRRAAEHRRTRSGNTAPSGNDRHGLAVHPEDPGMRIGLAEPHAGIVDEEFGCEVVGRFDHEIVGGDDLGGIRR